MPWESNQPPGAAQSPMASFPDITLSEEELVECESCWRTLFPPDPSGGAWYMKEGFLEPLKRSVMAFALIGRAERFAILAYKQPECRARACETAAKACAVYPLSAYFYDFAAILERVGHIEEARAIFSTFLRQPEAGPVREIDEAMLRQRDIAAMMTHARAALGKS